MTPEEQRQAEIEGQRMAEERINDLQAILDQAKKVAVESRPKPRFCGNCAPVDGGRFCSNCGSAL